MYLMAVQFNVFALQAGMHEYIQVMIAMGKQSAQNKPRLEQYHHWRDMKLEARRDMMANGDVIRESAEAYVERVASWHSR